MLASLHRQPFPSLAVLLLLAVWLSRSRCVPARHRQQWPQRGKADSKKVMVVVNRNSPSKSWLYGYMLQAKDYEELFILMMRIMTI